VRRPSCLHSSNAKGRASTVYSGVRLAAEQDHPAYQAVEGATRYRRRLAQRVAQNSRAVESGVLRSELSSGG